MKISKKNWAYRFTYRPWGASPNEVNMLKFGLHFLLTAVVWGVYWLVTGSACFLFALKQGKNNGEEELVPINDWPMIMGHRIWPLSLIGLGFIAWPFVDPSSWIKHDIFLMVTLFSLCVFIRCIFTKKTWQEIKDATKIVFIENGKA